MGFWLSRDRLVTNVGTAMASESEMAQGSVVVFPVKVVLGTSSEVETITSTSFVLGPLGGEPPRLADWDNYIDTYGPTHAQQYDQDWQEYDGDRVHRFLADYTGDPGTYMPTSAAIRDEYWLHSTVESGYRPAAYRTYANGLYYWALDNGFPSGSGLGGVSTVQEAFAEWADSWSFSWSDSASHYGQVYNREAAYLLLTCIRGEQLAGASGFNSLLGYSGNYPLNYRYGLMLGKAENHLRQWRNNDYTNPSNRAFIKPFMVGLTCYSLAQYYEQRGNENWGAETYGGGAPYWPDIPTAVEDMLTWLYNSAPNHAIGGNLLQTNYEGPGTYDSFPYIDRSGENGDPTEASPELNMILAPSYAWLGKVFNDSSYVNNYADRLFGGTAYHLSTSGASWWAENTSKQYNQLFYYAQEYFNWRQQA